MGTCIKVSFWFANRRQQNPEYEVKFIMSCNEMLAEYEIKNKISQLLLKYKHEYEKK